MPIPDQPSRPINQTTLKAIITGVSVLLIVALVTGGFQMYTNIIKLQERNRAVSRELDQYKRNADNRLDNHNRRINSIESYLYSRPYIEPSTNDSE